MGSSSGPHIWEMGAEDHLGEPSVSGQVDLRRYLPHVLVVTLAVALAPLWLGIWLTDGHPVWSTVVSIAFALAFGKAGAAVWKRTDASEDLVFDDLFAWGFLRRLRSQRNITSNVRRLGLDVGFAYQNQGLTREEQLKLLRALAVDLERGEPYTHGHSQRVARHAYMIARVMQVPRKQREKVRLAGLLHDVGKLRVPREVLNKPGRLTDDEFSVVQRHPGSGADMVAILGDDELTGMIRYHHERMDGTGYPEQRSGAMIPLGARIIAVADTFDAITSRRPYRDAQRHQVALEIMRREAGAQLDADVVAAFDTYYSGRRSIRWWLFLLAGWRHGVEALLVGLPRLGLVGVANAAAVGGAAVVFAGGSFMHAVQTPERAEPKERQRIVREAKENDRKAPGLDIAGETSDGVATSRAAARRTDRTSGSSAPAGATTRRPSSNEGPARAQQEGTETQADSKRPAPSSASGQEAVAAAPAEDRPDSKAAAVKQQEPVAKAPEAPEPDLPDAVEQKAEEANAAAPTPRPAKTK